MNDKLPLLRRDLEFFPVQHAGQQLILVRDHLGLVQEGRAISPSLYQLMALLESGGTLRDLQMELMRQKGGVLIGSDEVMVLLNHLDESFLLDSERFREARNRIIADFAAGKVRTCALSGQSYPENPRELKKRLDEILGAHPSAPEREEEVIALIAPHIDLSAGSSVYAAAYHHLPPTAPSRIIVLGVGHRMSEGLFSLSEKDFATPLGTVPCERALVRALDEAGRGCVATHDFAHRSEHSIEFQLVFLQRLLPEGAFGIVPILCGSFHAGLKEYSRHAFLEKAGPFLEKLKEILLDPGHDTMVVAGVDFSHIGPKFGHDMPAAHLTAQAESHDRTLLQHLVNLEADAFWEESRNVGDRFNVCGFSALACLLEILPPAEGTILDYRRYDEEATRSAVSFAAVAFTPRKGG